MGAVGAVCDGVVRGQRRVGRAETLSLLLRCYRKVRTAWSRDHMRREGKYAWLLAGFVLGRVCVEGTH